MKYLLIAFILSGAIVKAQDGMIVEQVLYKVPDSTLAHAQTLLPDIREVYSNVNFYHIAYLSDGLKVMGYLASPKKKGKFPCIIFNRGGTQEFGALTDEYVLLKLGRLASKGYVIIASQYRGNAGGQGQEEFGGSDVNDVLNLIPALNHFSNVDTSRIGMYGWSRGGMMTYLALAKTKSIRAAVVGGGISDLPLLLETRQDFDSLWLKLIPGYELRKTEVLKQRSAVYFSAHMCKTTPILILQGTGDWRVPANQALKLADKLYEQKHPFRLVIYEGGQHSISEFRSEYNLEIEKWFNTYLRDLKPWPSLVPHGD